MDDDLFKTMILNQLAGIAVCLDFGLKHPKHLRQMVINSVLIIRGIVYFLESYDDRNSEINEEQRE